MSVINRTEAKIKRGERANGILFDHDDDKTLGSLNTQKVMGTEGVSKGFASRNGGLEGIRQRQQGGKGNKEAPEAGSQEAGPEDRTANNTDNTNPGTSRPANEEGPNA